jgi:hypothetical protein
VTEGDFMGDGIIRISRGTEAIGGRRSLPVYVDGVQVGKVGRNRSAEFAAPPGQHIVYVRLDWCSSLPVTVELREGETIELAVTVHASERRGLRKTVSTPGEDFELHLRPIRPVS